MQTIVLNVAPRWTVNNMRLIDADAMLEVLNSIIATSKNEMFNNGLTRACVEIQRAEIKEPAKHGRWVANEKVPHNYHCSECGYSEWIISKLTDMTCCPRCRAIMDPVYIRLIDADILINKLKKHIEADKTKYGTGYIGTLIPIERVIKLIDG